MVTKKDFKAVAEIVKNSTDAEYKIFVRRSKLVNQLAHYFILQNPRFDRERFMKACGLGD